MRLLRDLNVCCINITIRICGPAHSASPECCILYGVQTTHNTQNVPLMLVAKYTITVSAHEQRLRLGCGRIAYI